MPDNKGYGGHHPKPVDWQAIEDAVKGGASHNSLAKQFDISRQRIHQRAKKEGWKNGKQRFDLAKVKHDEMTFTQWIKMPDFGQLTHSMLDMIIALISEGYPEKTAIAYCGIPDRTWRDYKSKNAELKQAVIAARAGGELESFKAIGLARKRGDWKAAKDLLIMNPDTRGTYGEQEKQGTKITVNINIPDPGTEITGEVVACVSGG